jgi:hypothetical protein
VFVHLGFPKTGTTTIQNVFHAHRNRLLAEEGVLYPSLSPNLTNVLCTNFLDDPLKHITNQMAGISREEARERGRQQFLELESEIASTQWRTLVLSAEGLSNLSALDLSHFREWVKELAHRVEALVCVREPLAYTASVIQQILKGGATLGEMYESPPTPNYKGKLSNAIEVFGRDKIRVFCFESWTRTDGGLVSEFARQVGLSDSTASWLADRASRENESLTELGVSVLDAMNRIRPMFVEGKRNPRRSGRELAYISRLGGRRYSLPHAVAECIHSSCVDDVRWLNETFALSFYPEISRDFPMMMSGELNSATEDPEVAASIAEVIGELVNRNPGRHNPK